MTTIDPELLERATEDADLSAEDKVKAISVLAQKQIKLEREVYELELKLDEAKDRLAQVKENQFPALLADAGLKDFTLDDGRRVVLNQSLYASLDKENKEAAVEWVEEHGFHGLITTKLEIPFERNEEGREHAKHIYNAFKMLGIEGAYLDSAIHHSTLSAFIRELEAKNSDPEADKDEKVDIPWDYFKVSRKFETKIKEPRKSRK